MGIKAETINGIFRPDWLLQDFSSNDTTYNEEIEKPILQHILGNKRYRMAVVDFIAKSDSPLTPQEKRGLSYFVGLVSLSDDVSDEDSTHFSQAEDLEEFVLSQKISIKDGKTTLTLAELKQLTLESFSEDKRELIETFLHNALKDQLQAKAAPGTYGYEEALDYRMRTTGEYSRVGALLAGVTDKQHIQRIIDSGMLWQFIDDANDVKDDAKKGNKNLFIGLAQDINPFELYYLQEHAKRSKGSFCQEYLTSRDILAEMPCTRIIYRDLFNDLLSSQNTTNRFIVESASELFL